MGSELGYPRRSKEEIEALAEELLQDYSDHIGSTSITPPIPVEDIAEHYLGYSIEITNEGLFADPEMLGGIDFDQMLIFANQSVEDHDGRYSFTVAHEIGHHVLHKQAYLEQRSNEGAEILCRDTQAKPQIEVEADRFAAALLMPTQVVSEVVLALGKKQRVNSIGQARGLASAVVKAGNFKNVSNSAMINRLIDLAIIPEHIGHQSGIYRRGPKPYSAARLLRGMLRRLGL